MRDRLRFLESRLQEPRGGTEIGGAIHGAIQGSRLRDLLLLTDGKSHALDVQALARSGRRVSAVLVGEDSLEANVGHLAALTGGDLFVATDGEISKCLVAALSSLRSAHEPGGADASGDRLRLVRRNAVIEVEWRQVRGAGQEDLRSRAAAALVAGLRLADLPEDEAAALAEAEGLVTHLTSLVLVDHQGEAQEGIPVTRKTPLPEPRTAFERAAMGGMRFLRLSTEDLASPDPAAGGLPGDDQPAEGGWTVWDKLSPEVGSWGAGAEAQRKWTRLLEASEALDWNVAVTRLAAGDLSPFRSAVAKEILSLAGTPEVVAAAEQLGLDPLMLVIGVLARRNASRSRAADRLARRVFRSADEDAVQDVLRNLAAAETAAG